MTHTVEYRAADRANRWATTALVLAIVTLAISLTFFWFYGIPPLVFGATSLYYAAGPDDVVFIPVSGRAK